MSTWSLSRTAEYGGTDPLVFHGSKNDGTPSVLRDGWIEPALRPRIESVPPAGNIHGSELYEWAWEESVAGLKFRLAAQTETAFQSLFDEIALAISQVGHTLTRVIGGHTKVYTDCKPGELRLLNQARQPSDVGLVVDYFSLTIPCYPPVVTPA